VSEAPDHRQAVADIGRGLRYIRPVAFLFSGKIAYGFLSLIPTVVFPWPGKVLIDHVIQGLPLDATRYPFFFQPIVDSLEGATPWQMAVAMLAVALGLLAIFGGTGTTDSRDQTGGSLAQGTDIATRSENQANQGYSFVGGVVGFLEYRLTLRLAQALNHHYRSGLFERIQRLPMTRLDDQRIGDAIFRLMYDTPQITEVCLRLVLTPLLAPASIFLTVWVMWATFGDVPEVIWAALLLGPASLLLTLPFTNALRRYALRARRTGSATTSTIEEGVANVLVVQGLGGHAHEQERFEEDSWRSYTDYRNYQVLWWSVVVVFVLAGVSAGTWLFYALSDRVFEETLTIGDLGVIFSYFGVLAFTAESTGRLWIYLQDNVVGLRRVFELMDEPSDHQPDDPERLDEIREGYRFEGVGFHYPDGTRALQDVSFEAHRGEMIAIAGPAGAGKTTLAYLLPRFLSPTEGRIDIDGVDLQRIDRDDLRRQIAFVFQEPVLFDATVAENIRFGDPEASDEAVRRAAEIAGAAEFIERLPQGYDTPLGRGGGRLSVGQKQRLSIARALVREAPVLVLDEPTAALDPETEMMLVETLREVSRDRLVVVIAHRLSTIRSAQQILFVEEGRIRERGSHAELMAREGGAYRHFVELQSSEAA
jgi:ABC-type multidrug transport system fused ATPase/permease subunit